MSIAEMKLQPYQQEAPGKFKELVALTYNAGGKRFTAIESPAERRKRENTEANDTYHLQMSYRPSTLCILMAKAGLIAERPVLAVYKGQRSGKREYMEIHLGGAQ